MLGSLVLRLFTADFMEGFWGGSAPRRRASPRRRPGDAQIRHGRAWPLADRLAKGRDKILYLGIAIFPALVQGLQQDPLHRLGDCRVDRARHRERFVNVIMD